LLEVQLAAVTVVDDGAEAEMLCGLLRAKGIDCSYRRTVVAAGAWTGWACSGCIEVLVPENDLDAARELLPQV
jgi:hypothetical protein